ncbi:17461_t:CDS:1, partial [Gigaspora rosea]
TNSSTTKLAFTSYSISLSRLIDHFGDNEPKKIKTMISVYLNWHARMIKNDAIENFKEKLEDQIKKLKEITNLYDKTFEKKIGKIIKALENQKEELVNTILTCERAEINHKIIRINVSLLYLIKHITNLVNEEKKTPDDNIEMSSSGEENIDLNSKENIDSDSEKK